jgi:uncharacterized membrane protein YciS (DUF1049 family)
MIRAILNIANKIIFIAILAIVVVFCLNNHQPITLSLDPLPFEVETKIFIALLLTFFAGFFIGLFSCCIKISKEKLKNLGGNLKIKFLQSKIDRDAKKSDKKLQKLEKKSQKDQDPVEVAEKS